METEHKILISRIVACLAICGLSFLPALPAWACVATFALAYAVIGADVVYRAVRNLLHGNFFDEHFLMSIATLGAFAIGEYPEAVAVMLFYQVGELFQDIAIVRSRASISSLMDIRPDYANIEEDGELRHVAPDDVPGGSVIIVKPGEKIPLDGVVISGESSVDTSALTGESLPRDVSEGNPVVSGSLNMTGVIRVRTSGEYGESTVARILELVENADTGKAKAEKFMTRFARYYTPAVVAAAVLLAVVPSLVSGGNWTVWLNRALIFLVVSCPCALVVSIPLTFFAGIGGASRRGILIKGSNYLEILARVGTVVFDKTGTLTYGNFSVTAVHPEIISGEMLVELAALAEMYSDHPVAVSLRSAYGGQLDKERVADVKNFAGEGIFAVVDGREVYAGNDRLMSRAGVEAKQCEKPGTIVHLAVDGVYMGHIVVSDSIKPEAADAVSGLRRSGVKKVVMLTGDRQDVAEEVSGALGIDEVYAGLLPADKVSRMEELRSAGSQKIAFVGDGINDAPVLKLADVWLW